MTYPTLHSLLESSKRHRELSIEDSAKWLQANAPKQLGQVASDTSSHYSFGRLWRGVDSYPRNTGVIVDPTTSLRRAREISDLYRIVLDAANPSFPSRGHSLITTTSVDTASEWGDVFCVFPPDDAVVGYVGQRDMWYTGVQAISMVVDAIAWNLDGIIQSLIPRESPHHDLARQGVETVRQAINQLHRDESADVDSWRSTFTRVGAHLAKLFALIGIDPKDIAEQYQTPTNAEKPSESAVRKIIARWLSDPSNDLMDGLIEHARYSNHGISKMRATDLPEGDSEVWIGEPSMVINPDALYKVMTLIGSTE